MSASPLVRRLARCFMIIGLLLGSSWPLPSAASAQPVSASFVNQALPASRSVAAVDVRISLPLPAR